MVRERHSQCRPPKIAAQLGVVAHRSPDAQLVDIDAFVCVCVDHFDIQCESTDPEDRKSVV